MRRVLIATAIAVTLCPNAVAEQGAWLGLAIGDTDLDVVADALDDGSFVAVSQDSRSTSFRLVGGYDFNANFGVEASYTDFGSATISAVSDGSGSIWPAGPIDADLEATSMNFGVNGYLPFNAQVRAFGRIGIAMRDFDATVNASGSGFSGSEDGNDPYFGIGVEGDMGQKVSGSVSYLSYYVDGDYVNCMELGVKLHLKK
jgi:OmpA-OmpF porin, OOP family